MSSVTSAAAMKLLDVRLKHAGSIITSAIGEFSTAGEQEIVCLRAGGTIDLFRIVITSVSNENDDESDEEEVNTSLKLMKRVETRSTLRSLTAIRISGSKKDVILVGADGGCLSLLAFDADDSTSSVTYKILHCPSFGKSGCRRDTPGQYIASDPRGGRAVMIASTEKRKLVYVLNRDSGGNITIASPLEAHRPRTLVFDLVGLDNGFDNPIFASLEVQYPDYEDAVLAEKKKKSDKQATMEEDGDAVGLGQHGDGYTKQVAYYELDLGLNHVSRRWATSTLRSACCLATIPGGLDGPSGVLVGGEDYIEYLHETMTPPSLSNGNNSTTPKRLICAIPRRELHPKSKGVLITNISVLRQKKGKFFALAQSELGDVYKVTLQMSKDDKTVVKHMTICLLDTLPIGNALNISKLALLFVPAEFGNHELYQFDAIDIEDAAVKCTSEETLSAFVESGESSEEAFYSSSDNATAIAPTFRPTILKNMHKVFTLDSLAPVTSVLVGELAGNEVSPQFYTLCGRGPRSTLRVLRHGLSVTELAVSELPGVPGGVFNIRDDRTSQNGKCYDRYIVVSFADATLVLSVGETVEEMGKESGFLTSEPTLACAALGNGDKDGGIVQVCPGGVRHIRRVNNQVNVSQWSVPGIKKIECASANESQILIALAGGELFYFELDPMSGNLVEALTRDVGTDVCCLDVGPVAKGKSRSLFAVVGSRDSNVRLLSLAPGTLLQQKSSTTLGVTKPYSAALSIVDGASGASELTMTVGLEDGSALQANVDPITGAISTSPSRRFLGARPVAVSRITLEGSSSTLLLSSRPWIGRNGNGRHAMAPMSYAPLDHGCSFSNEAVREGIVATSGRTLRILSVGGNGGNNALFGNDDDEAFNATDIGLRYTPRQMCLLSAKLGESGKKIVLAMVESDCNDYGAEEKRSMGFVNTGRIQAASKRVGSKSNDDAMDMDEDSDDDASNEEKKEEVDEEDEEDIKSRLTPIRGPVPSKQGCWASCVRLVDPQSACRTLDCVELNRNEAALCCASVRFHSRGGESLLAVGTVTSMTMHPLGYKESHIVLYRVVNGERLQFLHRTRVGDGAVLSLVHFQGRLLVGVGRTLRLYEMGKRQLLKKCELRGMPTMVKTLQAAGDRAYIGDMMQSLHFIRYDSTANRLVLVAKDRSPRPITCQELLDMNTVAVGDKFGNVSILRLPGGADVGAIDVTGTRALWDSSREDATPKLQTLCTYHVGEVVTSMTRASLVAGGAESLVYVTVTGRVGAFVPFTSREDVEFYTSLEGYLRMEAPRPTGRDPQAYRSYYAPTKHIIDGDLCDEYSHLPYVTKQKIADQLDRSVGEVIKKLEDTKNALL